MNGGIHDGLNLADKLARVIHGEAGDDLLDLYSRQRRHAAVKYVQAQTIANKRLMEERDPAVRKVNFDELRRTAENPDDRQGLHAARGAVRQPQGRSRRQLTPRRSRAGRATLRLAVAGPTSRHVAARPVPATIAVIPIISDIIEQTRLAARALAEFGEGLFNPTVRLGVTGLSRAGKTVFITALVHGLMRGGRFPVFEPLASGRIAGAQACAAARRRGAALRLREPRARAGAASATGRNSTRQISELRVVIDYQSLNGAMRTLTLDIVDYPGEWLLDLPLLRTSYEQWSAESARAFAPADAPAATMRRAWHAHARHHRSARAAPTRSVAIEAARLFTDYLQACRKERSHA